MSYGSRNGWQSLLPLTPPTRRWCLTKSKRRQRVLIEQTREKAGKSGTRVKRLGVGCPDAPDAPATDVNSAELASLEHGTHQRLADNQFLGTCSIVRNRCFFKGSSIMPTFVCAVPPLPMTDGAGIRPRPGSRDAEWTRGARLPGPPRLGKRSGHQRGGPRSVPRWECRNRPYHWERRGPDNGWQC